MSPGCSTAPFRSSSRLQTAAQPTPMEASVVPSQLVELGQQALTDVRISVANGEPLVRCQLLGSEFYEALKRPLRAPEFSRPAQALLTLRPAGSLSPEATFVTRLQPVQLPREPAFTKVHSFWRGEEASLARGKRLVATLLQ